MPNYQNSKIYQIVSPSHPEVPPYYGSTTTSLSVRMAGHRRSYKLPTNITSKLILCYDDATILLIENCPCNSKEELDRKEGEYILNNDCVNKKVSGRTRKEHYLANKGAISEQQKIYYEANKGAILEQQKKYCQTHKEAVSEWHKAHYTAHKEAVLEQSKKYYQANKGAILERRKKYRQKQNDLLLSEQRDM